MKRVLLLLPMVLLVLVACRNDIAEEDYATIIPEEVYVEETYENENYYRDKEMAEDSFLLDIEHAAYYLTRLQEMWDADGGEMWGVSLHIPVVIFCADTHEVLANQPDDEGEFVREYIDNNAVYTGIRELLPPDYDDTRIFLEMYLEEYPEFAVYFEHWPMYWRDYWNEQMGLFISWQWLQFAHTMYGRYGVFDRSLGRLMTINHSAFHALQPSLMDIYGNLFSEDTLEDRISFQLEVNALVYAINSSGDERLAAIHDTLSIRHARRYNFHTAYYENRLKLSEGTAVYTELHLVFSRDEIDDIIQTWPESFMEIEDVVEASKQYGYYAGALYGILLDDLGVSWRPYVESNTDLGLMLQEAVGINEMIPFDEIDLERYGYSVIMELVEQ